ncbi:MAG: hypothetical protein ACREKR_13610 [Candidatus Methylomirabilales bacterium]
MPEVKEACRRALEAMGLTIKQEGPRQVRNNRQAAARLQTLITQHPKSREAQVARGLIGER